MLLGESYLACYIFQLGRRSSPFDMITLALTATTLFRRAILESPGLTQVKQWDDAATNFRFILASLAAARSPGCSQSDGYDILRSEGAEIHDLRASRLS